jgi:[ribosomal protein S5]-alanine N-acetyltransferase
VAEEIRTERLLLRRARLDDVPAMHSIMSDALAMRYWSTPPHSDMVKTERWVASMVRADEGASDDFVAVFNGQLIGKLGAWKLPEIGFLFRPDHWGRGFASEALRAFIDRRIALGSAELTADVDPRNSAALRLLKRAGFLETHRAKGTWQVGDELCDSVYLRLNVPQD